MSAVPNLFLFDIDEALAKPNATPETVAAAVAASDSFLKAVRLAMEVDRPAEGWTMAQVIRIRLAEAFSAGIANGMFPPLPGKSDA